MKTLRTASLVSNFNGSYKKKSVAHLDAKHLSFFTQNLV